MKCPVCQCAPAHRSRRRWYDRLLKYVGIGPFRCGSCNARFYRYIGRAARQRED